MVSVDFGGGADVYLSWGLVGQRTLELVLDLRQRHFVSGQCTDILSLLDFVAEVAPFAIGTVIAAYHELADLPVVRYEAMRHVARLATRWG